MNTYNSYMITNRNAPEASTWEDIVPLSGTQAGMLKWYMAKDSYETVSSKYSPQDPIPSATQPQDFKTAIEDSLSGQPTPRLVVYIHGLGNTWDDAVKETQEFAKNLATLPSFGGGYTGLVVGFSWPSYDLTDSADHYASPWPPKKKSGTIRDNIYGSVQSFVSLMTWLNTMSKLAKVSIMCHSEGNYMAMLGLAAVSDVQIDQVVLLAADMNNAALQMPPKTADIYTGLGENIATLSNRVTVYNSTNDDTLATSQGLYSPLLLHNPMYYGRLGQCGPSYNQGAQQPKMVGVDCSDVVNQPNVIAKTPFLTTLHSSYRYIPQVLADITQTLQDEETGSASFQNRTVPATANPNSYYMKLSPA